MRRSRRARRAPLCGSVVCAAIALAGCGAGDSHAGSRGDDVALTIAQSSLPRGKDTLWWQHLAESSAAVAWLGPILGDRAGHRFRIANLLYHIPGNERPIGAYSRAVDLDSREPLRLDSDQHTFQLMPKLGYQWGSVTETHHIKARLVGFR